MDLTIISVESISSLITTIILGLLLIPAFIRLRTPENVVVHLLVYLLLVFTLSLTILVDILDLPLLSDGAISIS